MAKDKPNTGYSMHHLLPKSMGGNNSEGNLLMIKNTTHRAIHTLFENKMFADQLITMIDINQSALRKDVIDKLINILDSRDISDPYDRYKRNVIK